MTLVTNRSLTDFPQSLICSLNYRFLIDSTDDSVEFPYAASIVPLLPREGHWYPVHTLTPGRPHVQF